MSGFTKLFASIIHSTVWREEMHVKVVWITMLAMADSIGRVEASLPGLADAARVSIPQTEEALARLAAPDQYSRTKDYEGRRIEEIDGGWLILNYLKYRETRDAESRREQNREAQRRWRERHSVSRRISEISQDKPKQTQKAEADEERDVENTLDHFAEWYEAYPKHVARQAATRAWSKLTDEERQECVKLTPLWTEAHRIAGTEVKFIPYPATFLNGRRWQDNLAAITMSGKPRTWAERANDLAGQGRDYSDIDGEPAPYTPPERKLE